MASDNFLKLTDIEGESQDDKHKNEIDITWYQWGAHQPGAGATGSGSGSGKVQVHDFAFQAKHSKASPKLMLACNDGSHIASAVFTLRKAGKEQQEFSVYTMSDCIVTKYETTAPIDDGGIPDDKFNISFSKIEHQYKEQKADGTLGGAVKTGWDTKANKAS